MQKQINSLTSKFSGMAKEKEKLLFNAEDLPLIEQGLSLFEDLYIVLYALKSCKQKVKFPIESIDSLNPIFDRNGRFKFKNWELSFIQVKKMTPKGFFPIESEKDFLTRFLMVFQIGTRTHAFDQMKKKAGKEETDGEFYLIPTPQPIPFFPNN